MKVLKFVAVIVTLAGLTGLGLALAPSVYGQSVESRETGLVVVS